jgi:hypothetical protein
MFAQQAPRPWPDLLSARHPEYTAFKELHDVG